MPDYCAAYQNPEHPYYREAKTLVTQISDEANYSNGVMRWKSNDQVPPTDVVEFAHYLLGGKTVDINKCRRHRNADLKTFITQYKADQKPPTEEERFEERAAPA
jgi:hypothetical protein